MTNNLIIVESRFDANKNIFLWKQEEKLDDYFKKSTGIVISANNNIYVLTCAHGIIGSKSNKSYIKLNGQICECNLEKTVVSFEFDIAILTLSGLNKKLKRKLNKILKAISMDNFIKELPKKNTQLFIQTHDTPPIITTVVNIKHTKMYSVNLPLTIVVNVQIDDSLDKMQHLNLRNDSNDVSKSINKLFGLSGTYVLNTNNKIVGIVGSCTDNGNIVSIIPSIIIRRVMEEYCSTGICGGLCSVPFNGEIKDNNLVVIDNYGINKKLVKGDIIRGISNNDNIHRIDKDGLIWMSELKWQVSIGTFISLKYKVGDKFKLLIDRLGNNISININAKSINQMINIPFRLDYDKRGYEVYNGMVFVEFCEDHLKYYLNNNIQLIGSLIRNHIEKPYVNNQLKRVVVLIDIVRSPQAKYLDVYKRIGLPLINAQGDAYYMSILTKIDKKTIINLDVLRKVLSKKKNKKTFNFELDHGMCYKLIFAEGSVKYKV